MPLRNLPTDHAEPLAGLIAEHPSQVSSMSLARDAGADITLLAFAPGESVSEEVYFGDTLYYLVEGEAAVSLPGGIVPIAAGEVLRVPAQTPHGIENVGVGFKLLQLTLR